MGCRPWVHLSTKTRSDHAQLLDDCDGLTTPSKRTEGNLAIQSNEYLISVSVLICTGQHGEQRKISSAATCTSGASNTMLA